MTAVAPARHVSLDPSRWSRRLVLAAIAVAGALVAGYLAAYQFGILSTVWDPFHPAGSVAVLHSPMERLLPLPDAALGAMAYLAELVTDLIGGRERWRRQPWAVLLFGLVVLAMVATSATLVAYQVFGLRQICTLCLVSAALSFVAAALAVEEVLATIDWLRGETAMGRDVRDAVLHGDGDGADRHRPVRPFGPGAMARADTDASRYQPGAPIDTRTDNPPAGQPVRPTSTIRRHRLGLAPAEPPPSTFQDQEHAMTDYATPNPIPGTSPNTGPAARPGGPDVDGGNEQLWRQPDQSTTPTDHSGVVVVTGAAAGLGRAIVREFAKHGYDVGLIARDEGSLANAKAEVESVGHRAVICAIDVADADAVDQAADRIERELGPIDVWVNDAMVSIFSPVKEMQPEGYKRVTEVNYLGYVYGTMAALKRMLPRDEGVIVHVGSALAYRAIPLQSAYCASKHAIQGFHESLRTELLHDKSHVRTTMVQMPALNTPQFDWVKSRMPDKPQPVPPIYDPEVGAEAVYWAAHHDRREVVVGVTTWGAIQLNKLVPGMLDMYLARTGYKSQQTSQPDDPDRPNDVWEPVPGDRGGHGRFDSRSKPRSTQVWATTHRGLVATAVGLIGLVALGGLQMATSLLRSDDHRG